MKSITVKQLRESLELLGPGHDDKEVKVWLPGSTISLGTSLFMHKDGWAIEGNLDNTKTVFDLFG